MGPGPATAGRRISGHGLFGGQGQAYSVLHFPLGTSSLRARAVGTRWEGERERNARQALPLPERKEDYRGERPG